MNTLTHDPALIEEMRAAGLLSDADIADLNSDIDAPEGAVDDAVIAEIDASVTNDDAKRALYAEQENTVTVISVPDAEEAAAAEIAATPKKERAASTGAKKSRLASSGTLGDFAASVAGTTVSLTPSLEIKVADFVNGIHAKKVQEKAANFFAARHGSATLSVFTRIAIETLKNAGKLNAKSLADVYMTIGSGSKCYSIGTARSQAQQMTTLLSGLQIVKRDGDSYVPNEDSTYWASFA